GGRRDDQENVGARYLDGVGAVATGGAGDGDRCPGGELLPDRGDLDDAVDRRLAGDRARPGPGAAVCLGAAEGAADLECVVGDGAYGELASRAGDAAEVGQGDLIAADQAVARAGDGERGASHANRLGRAEAGVTRDDGHLPGGRAVADGEL